mgnify:CR=1 FL=1
MFYFCFQIALHMKTTIISFLMFLILSLISGQQKMYSQLQTIIWDSVTVKSSLVSCGFLDIGDMDNNGKQDIILSTLMESGSAATPATTKGAIRVFKTTTSTGYPTAWSETIVLPTSQNLPFINTPQVFDADGDGNLDIFVQQGFLQTDGGSHQWIKGPALTQREAFTPQTAHGSTDYFWHESCQYDLDGDGLQDIITTSANNEVSPVAKKVEWYRNMGGGVFEYHLINDSLGGVFIKMYDVDSDGNSDIVLSQFFGPPAKPSLVWLRSVALPSAANGWAGTWSYHKIDHTTGLGYYFEFFDINGDGIVELVYGNHNNLDNTAIVDPQGNPIPSGLYYFDIPADPASVSQWTRHTIDEGYPCNLFDFGNPASQGSPGIWAHGDIDQNGYMDMVVPGDGMAGLYLVRQNPDHSFVREKITNGKMWGMVKVVDFDNNGVPEIVASLHNFPNNFIEAMFGLPAGKLMIYRPANISVGLNESQSDRIVLYPNPATENICIDFNDEEHYSVRITDLQGRIINEFSVLNTPKFSIDISHLKSGMYIIESANNKGKQQTVFTKN